MSNQDIIEQVFFNEIINESSNSEVSILEADGYEHIYNIGFNVCIEGRLNSGNVSDSKPILMINNKKQLLNMLEKYINEVDRVHNYFSDCDYKNKIKAYMSFVWSNAIYEDFASPCTYLKKQIDFLKNSGFSLGEKVYATNLDFSNIINDKNKGAVELLNGSEIITTVKKQDIKIETPYVFETKIKKDDIEYYLPSISYGISNGECYIYAVQDFNTSKEKDSLIGKSVEKVFHFLDEGIKSFETDEYNEYDARKKPHEFRLNEDNDLICEDIPENISRVSPMAIVALTIFLDSLLKLNIDKVKVVSCLPVRYYGKELCYLKKHDYLTKKGSLSEQESNKLLLDYKKEHLRIQKNLSEKLIRNFRRIEHHYDTSFVMMYPLELDEYLHFKFKDFTNSNNLLLNSIMNCKLEQKTK